MCVPSPISTSSSMTTNGSMVTPSPIMAPGWTLARGLIVVSVIGSLVIACMLAIDNCYREVCLGHQRSIDCRATGKNESVEAFGCERDLEQELIAGHYRFAELPVVDPHEEGELGVIRSDMV